MGTSDESNENAPSLPLPIQAQSVPPTSKEKLKKALKKANYAKYIVFSIYIFSFLVLESLRGGELQDSLERCKYQMISYILAIITWSLLLSAIFRLNWSQWAMKTDDNGSRRITPNAVIVLVTCAVLYGFFAYELWAAYGRFAGLGGRIEEYIPFLISNR